MGRIYDITAIITKFKDIETNIIIQTRKMPQHKIILLFSDGKSNENKLSKYFSDENILWTYLGPNYINFKRIDSYLREHFRYIEISERLDNISDKIRDQYQHYVDDLNNANKDTFEWWFTPISSRNPSMSGVFQNLCFLELIKEILSENSLSDTLVIVAENFSIGHAIEANADVLGIELITIGKNTRSLPSRITSGIWWTGKCLFKAGLNYGYARLSAIRTEKKPTQRYSGIAGKTCMTDVFVYEKNFADDGEFADRYFPGLEQFLIKNGYNVVYYPTFTETKLNKYNLYCKARANDRVFLIEQDFLKITDYFKSFKYALKSTKFRVNAPLFSEFDVAKIDDGDFKWDCFENIFKAYLQYYAFLRMSVSLGSKFERIISWHENQLQDKALCKAVHETSIRCKIIGSHAYLHANNFLNQYPLDSEAIMGYIPDIILSLGNSEVNKVKKYLTKTECQNSAALRYSKLFTRSECNVHSTENTVKNILVLLPYFIGDVKYLLTKIVEINSVYGNNCKFILKCHPDYNVNTLKSIFNFESIHTNIQFTEKDIYSISSSICINAVISMSSSIIIESASLGLPTIVMFNHNSLTYDLFDKESWINVIKCHNNRELFSALDHFFAIDELIAQNFKAEGEKVLNAHFSLSKSNILSDYIY